MPRIAAPKGYKLVRRHVVTGKYKPRKRGRPHPDYESGYVDPNGQFQPGNPPKGLRRPGRPPSRRAASPVLAGGLQEIELLVEREVRARLNAAREAALAAINQVLG